MKWLITTKTNIDIASLREKLSLWGCQETSQEPPVTLGADEQVIEIVCPTGIDLRERAKGEAMILQINPSSELELYGSGTDLQ